MSITKVSRSKNIRGAMIYVIWGTSKAMKDSEIRADKVSVQSRSGMDALAFVSLAEADAENSKTKRKNQAILVIQAWSPEELSAMNYLDVDTAHAAGVELAQRIAPHSDFAVATHTDSNSHHVHNHIVISNHDWMTGSTPKNAGNFHYVKRVNDEVMREFGLEVTVPHDVRESQSERRSRKSASLTTFTPGKRATRENWKKYLRYRIDELTNDERVLSARSPDVGLEIMREIAGDYRVSMEIKEGKGRRSGTSFALLDPDHKVWRYPVKRGFRRAATTGKQLGKKFTTEGLKSSIARAQAAFQIQKKRLDRENAVLLHRQEIENAEIQNEELSAKKRAEQALGNQIKLQQRAEVPKATKGKGGEQRKPKRKQQMRSKRTVAPHRQTPKNTSIFLYDHPKKKDEGLSL